MLQKLKYGSREKTKNAQIKKKYIVCGCMLTSGKMDMVCLRPKMGMFPHWDQPLIHLTRFAVQFCTLLSLYTLALWFELKVSWNKILAELMANVDMVNMIVIPWFLVKNCCPDIFRKGQGEYLTLVLLFLSDVLVAHRNQYTRVWITKLSFQKITICKMSTGLICNDWIREVN